MQDQALSKTVAQDMKPTVGAAVQEHLGAFSTGMLPSAAGATESQESPILALFRNPQTLRQVMIANIVLAKPSALAKRDR